MSLFTPKTGSGIRRPTDNSKYHGRIINPPRYSELGGLDGASKAMTHAGNAGQMKIVKPGGGAK